MTDTRETIPPKPPMRLISQHRDPGVHAVTAECDCGVTFIFHSDGDIVVCPNCKSWARWRNGQWSSLNPTLAAKAPLMQAALQKEDDNASRQRPLDPDLAPL